MSPHAATTPVCSRHRSRRPSCVSTISSRSAVGRCFLKESDRTLLSRGLKPSRGIPEGEVSTTRANGNVRTFITGCHCTLCANFSLPTPPLNRRIIDRLLRRVDTGPSIPWHFGSLWRTVKPIRSPSYGSVRQLRFHDSTCCHVNTNLAADPFV